jgi:hypothetical protein
VLRTEIGLQRNFAAGGGDCSQAPQDSMGQEASGEQLAFCYFP